jgi:hypothetical protein
MADWKDAEESGINRRVEMTKAGQIVVRNYSVDDRMPYDSYYRHRIVCLIHLNIVSL